MTDSSPDSTNSIILHDIVQSALTNGSCSAVQIANSFYRAQIADVDIEVRADMPEQETEKELDESGANPFNAHYEPRPLEDIDTLIAVAETGDEEFGIPTEEVLAVLRYLQTLEAQHTIPIEQWRNIVTLEDTATETRDTVRGHLAEELMSEGMHSVGVKSGSELDHAGEDYDVSGEAEVLEVRSAQYIGRYLEDTQIQLSDLLQEILTGGDKAEEA